MKTHIGLSMVALATAALIAACGSDDSPVPGTDTPVAGDPIPAKKIDYCEPGPGDQPETGIRGGIPAADRGPARNEVTFKGFWCGARKVAQHKLFDRGAFGDLQLKDRCAYASRRDGAKDALGQPITDQKQYVGTIVFDMKTPTKMAVTPDDDQVGHASFDPAGPNPYGKILRTPAMIRAYSALELQGNIMIGAYKDNGPTVDGKVTNPLDVYDVSDCLHPVPLSTTYNTPQGNHDGWLTPDGKTYYGIPFSGDPIIGRGNVDNGNKNQVVPEAVNRIDMHVTDLSDPRKPKSLLNWNRLDLPQAVQDNLDWKILNTTHFHDVSTNNDGTRVYMALYGGTNSLGGGNKTAIEARTQRCGNGLLIMDSSDIVKRVPNPKLKYISFVSWCDDKQMIDPDFGNGETASAHATEWVRHVNGKEYIVSTEESGGGLGGTPSGICAHQSYARMIDISDEKNPQVVGTYKSDANKPENCEKNLAEDTWAGMTHYLGFDDRSNMRLAVYASAYGGMRFVDWKDPTHPIEVAYYIKERNTSDQMDFTRPDPRYDTENCLYYTGWNQGGLVSVELTNPEYNPCMSRRASVKGKVASAKGSLDVSVEASRNGNGAPAVASMTLKGQGHDAQLTSVTRLGSAIDASGDITATRNSVQIDGNGTFDGKPATFRVLVQDNGNNTGIVSFACTSGCDFSTSGYMDGSGGNKLVVSQKN
ncbi:hypothetical protein [Pigmentiphaga kullae]|uniref:LVIVD repeat-containing protein n=1 Tax=Pigmentiphaga kullae TaxID=151784 RepID=A0A4Q7N7S3_9BURK|nr:hypothetical protein [Pigmentiphaga kullae]RZS78073.1 hypothetical protein EV675_4714 [Pigmentiphaga kullae]